jgi:hypothetical protein
MGGGGGVRNVFVFDTQSMTSDNEDGFVTSCERPVTPNILLTAPSMEMTSCLGDEMAETSLGGVVVQGGGKGGYSVDDVFTWRKTAELHSPPPSPFLTVPSCNSHGRGGGGGGGGSSSKSRISDSRSLTDLHDVTRSDSPRRSSCLSLNSEAKGRRKKNPRRVNFDLS